MRPAAAAIDCGSENYLNYLLTTESRVAHDGIWEAFDGIKELDIREKAAAASHHMPHRPEPG